MARAVHWGTRISHYLVVVVVVGGPRLRLPLTRHLVLHQLMSPVTPIRLLHHHCRRGVRWPLALLLWVTGIVEAWKHRCAGYVAGVGVVSWERFLDHVASTLAKQGTVSKRQHHFTQCSVSSLLGLPLRPARKRILSILSIVRGLYFTVEKNGG